MELVFFFACGETLLGEAGEFTVISVLILIVHKKCASLRRMVV